MSYEIALFISHYTGDGVVGDGPRLDEEVQMVDGADQNRRGGTWRGRFDASRSAERHFNLRERFCCRFAAEAVAVDRGHNCLLRLAIADGVVSIDGFR
jgi:hypothetical protein